MRYRSSARIGPEHVGRRLTVRYRLSGGQATDVVGTLERLDDRTLAVRDRDGDLVIVARADVVAARVVGEKPEPPPPPV